MQIDEFQIEPNLNGEKSIIHVTIRPTTDDADTYVCIQNNKEITQIRKDGGRWKQLWGDLDDAQVIALGNEIDKILTN